MFIVFVHNPRGDMLRELQTRLVDRYFCYREMNEDRVNFIKLPSEEFISEPRKEFTISLQHMFSDSDRLRKYVTFDGIKQDSCLRFGGLEMRKRDVI